ncbi:hypothetical protein SAMN02745131_00195 [Flavisolibacter ginsengisoli DSM 18119]|uniref:Uncharacterized protein n=1 Tax=Flavisolibacter ginsengisoli DSM 18119 TaxID=1121884 RepID=A0A1M4SQD3_9BACT|nr:hypothetical protein SAMN02745131_00195 [Flavisolibacter ginsengisoli DSM 18119]
MAIRDKLSIIWFYIKAMSKRLRVLLCYRRKVHSALEDYHRTEWETFFPRKPYATVVFPYMRIRPTAYNEISNGSIRQKSMYTIRFHSLHFSIYNFHRARLIAVYIST